ncbi:Hypothetical predicted protein [Octopus vulgaris]|uniref:Uncharacterized protein n=1 Tax=Octopus vulgaris TaxID=6645 RepID=A0AA36F0R7_OCTVU|nr:Hypothetical predicted protein [Octopus vulgaris]
MKLRKHEALHLRKDDLGRDIVKAITLFKRYLLLVAKLPKYFAIKKEITKSWNPKTIQSTGNICVMIPTF